MAADWLGASRRLARALDRRVGGSVVEPELGTVEVQAFVFDGELDHAPVHIGPVIHGAIVPFVYEGRPLPISVGDVFITPEATATLPLGYARGDGSGAVVIGSIEVAGLPVREGISVQFALGMTLEMDGRLQLSAHVRHALDAQLQIVDPEVAGRPLPIEVLLVDGPVRL
jgi:hypothetical protein